MTLTSYTTWEEYCQAELRLVRPLLAKLGFSLDETQIHLGGERSLISGYKLVLLGERTSDKKRVVIKASSHPEGQREMEDAHAARLLLDNIGFAYNVFLSPEELVWQRVDNCLISISAFVEQEETFLERPFEEQFFLAMKAFETQESAHATTYEHTQMIRQGFRIYTAETYLTALEQYEKETQHLLPHQKEIHTLFERARRALQDQRERIEQYCGFLTHTDFVPHNIRIVDRDIYLLDHYAIRFGNKYEGWARFLNFMLLHHRKLEVALTQYVNSNRAPEESEALRLMRIFRLSELVWYYAKRQSKSSGNLHALDQARVSFWSDALAALLDNIELPDQRIRSYERLRDQLRSEEEKRRQLKLH
jgi:hypothetical protein